MKYADGQEVRLGDRVALSGDSHGTVVCSIDASEYSADFPQKQWEYLRSGVIIRAERIGLIHYLEPDEDFELIGRQLSDTKR